MSDDLERCYLAAQRILNYRFNSETELRRKLRAKKYDPPTIDATIARLRKEKWLDDERFAGAFVRTRARRSIGAKRIRLELRAAGVNDDVASEAVRENVDRESEREHLRALIARRSALLETEQGRKKLISYLMRQGYDLQEINEELRS